MRFDHQPTTQLIRILKAGLGFKLNRRQRSAHEIAQLDQIAHTSGAHITWIEPQARTARAAPDECHQSMAKEH
ncbi:MULTISPECIES: hypothetical protein [unclassified Methylophilus]|jgi:hypothetical protein|uniref:Uncharacterized protein n=1 Tax=Methylophilus glucosoxydans TaxID=752553 RepID=A0ABW3GIC2_9PROT|nr:MULTISPECIES: hypothetical protein [unclassified Methylophilus]MBF5039450.1 hypothetical protein [Methylophilus sp. 13]MDF0377583.1 hypothetical protein [Methylophilus sp. YYY-1]BEV08870.1 hypothetical protein MTDW_21700 [Methylophilus sp. DW102]